MIAKILFNVTQCISDDIDHLIFHLVDREAFND